MLTDKQIDNTVQYKHTTGKAATMKVDSTKPKPHYGLGKPADDQIISKYFV